MRIKIYGLTERVFKRLQEEMNPSNWCSTFEFNKDEGLYNITLSDYVIFKVNHNRLTIDCGSHLSFIDDTEFVEVRII